MDHIHIAHFGGIELDDANARVRINQVRLVAHQLRTQRTHPIDFIVVSGSLTKAREFHLVSEFLDPLLKIVDGERRRVLLAPGDLDLNEADGSASEKFAGFFLEFFGHSYRSPSARVLDVRRFRDATLIAAADTAVVPSGSGLDPLSDLIRQETNDLKPACTWEALRFLAVAATPLLHVSNSGGAVGSPNLRDKIDLILCGRASSPLVPPQPFSHLPWTIGVSGNGSGSLYWNIVCVRRPPLPLGPDINRVQFLVKCYDEHHSYRNPAHQHRTAEYDARAPHIDSTLLCKHTLLEKLEPMLLDGTKDLIEVAGYGSAWKTIIAEGLVHRAKIDGQNVNFRAFPFNEYPKGKTEDWKKLQVEIPKLREIADWGRHLSHPTHLPPVALVVDQAYSLEDPDSKNQADEIRRRLQTELSEHVRVVYLVSAYDEPSKDCHQANRITLDPISPKTLDEFLRHASCEVPIDLGLFKNLTGGYVGFVKLLADECKRQSKPSVPGVSLVVK